jgi:cytochrome c-type biogenesis protein CcmH/NrfG
MELMTEATDQAAATAIGRGQWLFLGLAILALAGSIGFALMRSDRPVNSGLPSAEQSRPSAGLGRSGVAPLDPEAIAAMPRAEQEAMIAQMLGQLEERLRADPRRPEGWIMLMRSRMTLGQPDLAAKALRDGVAANPNQADRLLDEARSMGVPGS